jgi:hypothetical protein
MEDLNILKLMVLPQAKASSGENHRSMVSALSDSRWSRGKSNVPKLTVLRHEQARSSSLLKISESGSLQTSLTEEKFVWTKAADITTRAGLIHWSTGFDEARSRNISLVKGTFDWSQAADTAT